jgi:hypothetical protein
MMMIWCTKTSQPLAEAVFNDTKNISGSKEDFSLFSMSFHVAFSFRFRRKMSVCFQFLSARIFCVRLFRRLIRKSTANIHKTPKRVFLRLFNRCIPTQFEFLIKLLSNFPKFWPFWMNDFSSKWNFRN